MDASSGPGMHLIARRGLVVSALAAAQLAPEQHASHALRSKSPIARRRRRRRAERPKAADMLPSFKTHHRLDVS